MTPTKVKYVDVVFNLNIKGPLEYKISGINADKVKEGARVIVNINNRRQLGIIIKIKDKNSFDKPKEVIKLLDLKPIFSKELLKLTTWISDYYIATPGKCVFLALPPGYKKIPSTQYQVNPDIPDLDPVAKLNHAPLQKQLFQTILDKGPITRIYLKRKFKNKSVNSALKGLIEKDYIIEEARKAKVRFQVPVKDFIKLNQSARVEEKLLNRVPVQRLLDYMGRHRGYVDLGIAMKESKISRKLVNSLIDTGLFSVVQLDDFKEPFIEPEFIQIPDFELNRVQEKHLATITDSIVSGKYVNYLLYGVTGSGKTEIYIRAIEQAMGSGKTAICLVPEITLTPQVAGLFRARFGNNVGIFHSRLTQKERISIYNQILNDEIKVVIGPRSAIFVPLKNLGIIVVDEEQDQAYKQTDLEPRYSGRDVAIYRAYLNNCVCILSSATPSIESMYNTLIDKYSLLKMSARVAGRALPDKQIIDMRTPENRGKNFSQELVTEMKKRFDEGEQVLLFLNRRGFSRVLQCRECGYVFECKNCSVSLVYHLATHSLDCHYCDYRIKLPEECPKCDSVDLKFIGSGTEKIQEELKELFPNARIARLDHDVAIHRKQYQKVLADFKSHNIDVLIGTQMIAKGLDFLNVTLVGVINSDILVSFPDFRSLEQAFQLLTQVSGRAGRGERRGEVLIQSYQPDNEAIQYAVRNSYDEFFEFELPKREELGYPPYSHLIKFLFKAVSRDNAIKYARIYLKEMMKLRNRFGFTIMGPAPGLIERMKNKFRYLLVVRSDKRSLLNKQITKIHNRLRADAGRHHVTVEVTVDPLDLI